MAAEIVAVFFESKTGSNNFVYFSFNLTAASIAVSTGRIAKTSSPPAYITLPWYSSIMAGTLSLKAEIVLLISSFLSLLSCRIAPILSPSMLSNA